MPWYRSLEHSTILYEAPSASPSLSASSNFASVISDGSQPLLRLQFNRINHDLLATFRMDSDTVQILDIRYPSAPVAELTRSHRSNVNCFSWSPNHPGHICTGGKPTLKRERPVWLFCYVGDDSQVLVWDINSKSQATPGNEDTFNGRSSRQPHQRDRQHPQAANGPILRYVADSEINSLSWSQSLPRWIAVGFGRTVQALRV
jgi:WD repeat-containing protein 68